jgi:hypothetical protein
MPTSLFCVKDSPLSSVQENLCTPQELASDLIMTASAILKCCLYDFVSIFYYSITGVTNRRLEHCKCFDVIWNLGRSNSNHRHFSSLGSKVDLFPVMPKLKLERISNKFITIICLSYLNSCRLVIGFDEQIQTFHWFSNQRQAALTVSI